MNKSNPWVWIFDPRNHSLERWAVLGRLDAGRLAATQGREFNAPIFLGSRNADSVPRAPDTGSLSKASNCLSGDFLRIDLDNSSLRFPDRSLYECVRPAAGRDDFPIAAFVPCLCGDIRWQCKPSVHAQDRTLLRGLFFCSHDNFCFRCSTHCCIRRLTHSFLRGVQCQFGSGLFLGIRIVLHMACLYEISGRIWNVRISKDTFAGYIAICVLDHEGDADSSSWLLQELQQDTIYAVFHFASRTAGVQVRDRCSDVQADSRIRGIKARVSSTFERFPRVARIRSQQRPRGNAEARGPADPGGWICAPVSRRRPLHARRTRLLGGWMGFEKLHAVPPALCADCFRVAAACTALVLNRIDPDHFVRECPLHR